VIKLLRFLAKTALVLSFFSFFSLYNHGQEDREMTAHDVFNMVVQQGFYCEIVKGSGFHGEGLKGMPIPKDFIFKGKRSITAEIREKDFLETKSVPKEKKKNREEIVLGWPLQIKSQCSFQTAEGHIKIFNQKNTDKNKKWRIPTIMELFSIVQDQENTKNHFPKEFKLPENETLTFWTCTPVKKVGTFLEYDKDNKAYFVVQSSYNKRDGTYSLSFGFNNIEGENKENAFLLPVFSDKVYTYGAAAAQKTASPTPSTKGNGKIPGFDDYAVPPTVPAKKKAPVTTTPKQPATDRIPGFDDVPVNKPAVSPPGNNQSTIKISLFPHLIADTADDSSKQLLDYINDQVIQELDTLKAELKMRFNRHLIIDKMNPFNKNHMDKISALYFIVSDESLTDSEKISQIKNQIINPLDIDIILTIKYSLENSSGIEIMKPTVIDGLHNQIYEKVDIQNDKEQRYQRLRKKIKKMVKEIFFNDPDE
jgi:hypothetical protein